MPSGILIIGATGFVGTALVARLSPLCSEIFTIARGTGNFNTFNNVHHYHSCLDNTALLDDLLSKCRVVFHLASETTPGSSVLQPAYEAVNNLLPSLRFLECLQQYPHITLVYVSTGGAIYGDSDKDKITEDVSLSPLSYYGAGKAALEKFICAFSRQTGNPAIILRPSNIYGPGQSYRQGFGIVPTICNHILNGTTFNVWGDGEIIRDYLYIEDFVDLCLVILQKVSLVHGVNIYNVGSGEGVSIVDLISIFKEISGEEVKLKFENMRSVDVRRVVLNSNKIINKFKWNTKTDIQAGVQKTWEWFCANTNK